LIQRDYSNGGFYDYYTHGGGVTGKGPVSPQPQKQSGEQSKTDTGRAVYGGGGITPDENIQGRALTLSQRRLLSPAFQFARELVNGRIRGFENSRITGPNYNHELQTNEYLVSDALFKAFREFASTDPAFRLTPAIIDKQRDFLYIQLRFDIVTAAYGRVVGDRVFVTQDDPQVARAIEVVPKARDLAMSSRQSKADR